MIELIYFSRTGDTKKTYQVIQFRRGEPWQIVEGDVMIGEMHNLEGFWKLHTRGEIPEGMCTEVATLIESQHFNHLPDDIKKHWPAQVMDIVVIHDAEYLIICKPDIDMERFVRIFAAYTPYLLKDEWPVLFKVYNAQMSADVAVTVERSKR